MTLFKEQKLSKEQYNWIMSYSKVNPISIDLTQICDVPYPTSFSMPHTHHIVSTSGMKTRRFHPLVVKIPDNQHEWLHNYPYVEKEIYPHLAAMALTNLCQGNIELIRIAIDAVLNKLRESS